MTRTPTLPLDDKSMWRKAIARAHPDAGGSHELCVWIQAVRDVICSSKSWTGASFEEDPEPTVHPTRRHEGSTSTTADRIPFDEFSDFEVLTDRAVAMATAVAEPYGYLLRQLADCYPTSGGSLYNHQRCGASYKSLAAIGHTVGMTKAERVQWYRIAESIPLSQRHAGHILSRLERRAA
jgi:hypothetical protein